MRRLESLLAAAIHHYRELLEVLSVLAEPGSLGTDGEARAWSARLADCQNAARQADRELLQLLDEGRDSYRELPRMREYQALLRQVAARNQVLLDRLRTHRALVAAELAELRGTKAAVAGYRLPLDARGGRLSESC
jgi:hypothetical protein